jgi:hypothetical protein
MFPVFLLAEILLIYHVFSKNSFIFLLYMV